MLTLIQNKRLRFQAISALLSELYFADSADSVCKRFCEFTIAAAHDVRVVLVFQCNFGRIEFGNPVHGETECLVPVEVDGVPTDAFRAFGEPERIG